MRQPENYWPGPVALLGLSMFCALLAPAPAGASTIRDDQPDANYLALALNPEYASVGKCAGSVYNGAGLLVAPDWVLTAGHLFFASSSVSFTINGATYTSDRLVVNPGWRTGGEMTGYDFGLVHLSQLVPGVTPAALYTGSAEVGQAGTFVGFGMTGTGLTGYRTLDNKKRAFQDVIDGDFGNPAVLLGSDFDNPHNPADNLFGSATPLDLEGAVGPGDSGGGVFITVDSQTYLAGIISFVAATDGSANSDYGDVFGFGRVSAFTPWILSTIPEPSSALLVTAGLGMLAWRRARRAR